MAKRIDAVPVPHSCRYCSNAVVLTDNKEIYGRSYGKCSLVYLCRSCGAYVGVHPNTTIPLGFLADKATRQARKNCKLSFNTLWQEAAIFSRSGAYKWLARKMGISSSVCHFGMFEIEDCIKADRICRAMLEDGEL